MVGGGGPVFSMPQVEKAPVLPNEDSGELEVSLPALVEA